MKSDPHKHYETLLMKVIDGCASTSEHQELLLHIQECAPCDTELKEFGDIKDTTDAMQQRILSDIEHDPLRPDMPTRILNRLGFMAMLITVLVLVGYCGLQWARDDSLGIEMRVGVLLSAAVGLLVLLNIIRLRILGARTDPYKEIDQ